MPAIYPFARPQATVDVLLFTVRDFWREDRGSRKPRLEIVLVKRDQPPFEGVLALPGTVIRIEPDATTGVVDATDVAAARRVLREKVGVQAPHLEQLHTWFTRAADPRGPTVTIAYFAVMPFDHFRAGRAETTIFMPVDELPPLAFNHSDIVAKGVERVRGKASYSSLPALLMPDTFTFKELQSMYEAVLNRPFDQTNFGRRVTELGMVEPVEPDSNEAKDARARAARGQTGRPPQVFRLKHKGLVNFARTTFYPTPAPSGSEAARVVVPPRRHGKRTAGARRP
jgi:8-oxo-dGTP diphosphatase